MDSNLGGAGGFHEGFKTVMENYDFDYLWIMDDDVIPKTDSLQNLLSDSKFLEDKDENFSYLASSVFGNNMEMMNVPLILTAPDNEGDYPNWNKYLDNGLVKIESATFVSLLIKKDAIATVGLPIKKFFIWGDDSEYTQRLNKEYGSGYLSGKSHVLHKRVLTKIVSIWQEENESRVKKFFYSFRNNLLITSHYHGRIKTVLLVARFNFDALKNLKSKYWIKKWFIMQKGILTYIFMSKKKFFRREP
jgi:GT2 family glycosyltransferase